MTIDTSRLAPGLPVQTMDGTQLGTIARIWYPDGTIQPPGDPDQQGGFQIVTTERSIAPNVGFFQIDMPAAPDWFAAFTDVASVSSLGVMLNVTFEQAERRGFQQKPAWGPRT